MKVKNKRSYTVEIPEVGFVDPGESIDVPDELGKALLAQEDAWGTTSKTREGSN